MYTYILNTYLYAVYTRPLQCDEKGGGQRGRCQTPKHETETGINWIAHYVK